MYFLPWLGLLLCRKGHLYLVCCFVGIMETAFRGFQTAGLFLQDIEAFA